MAHIEIETEDMTADSLTSRKNGVTYFTAEQPALLFTDQSRYPLQFKLRLAFTESKDERDKVGSIAKGKYQIADSAFVVSRFGGLELAELSVKHLKPMRAAS